MTEETEDTAPAEAPAAEPVRVPRDTDRDLAAIEELRPDLAALGFTPASWGPKLRAVLVANFGTADLDGIPQNPQT